MRLSSLRRLIALVAIVLFAAACSGANSDALTPAPDEASGAERLGREVGETYLLLLDDARSMLELNLPAEQLRPSLGLLRDDYRVRFANLGCLRKAMPGSEQAEVERLAGDYVNINSGQDTTWLTRGAQRYAADSLIPSLLAEIQDLRVYAFFDQLSRARPGETILCD